LALVARAAGGDVKKLKVVTFNGGAESITAALGGHVDMVVAPAATLSPHVQSGGLRMIAIAAPKRMPELARDDRRARNHAAADGLLGKRARTRRGHRRMEGHA
jgi:tripartite-type tricarboxylate transporter receptor subunit TctC